MSERSGGEAAITLSSVKKHLGNRIITRSMKGSDNKTKIRVESFAILLPFFLLSLQVRGHVSAFRNRPNSWKRFPFGSGPKFQN